MNKNLKKWQAVIVMAALFLQLTGCGYGLGTDALAVNILKSGSTAGSTAGQSETDSAVRHLLTVWSDYIGVLDKMYASELWALDYVDAYLKSGDWSDLSKARTACIASARYLKELSMTEKDLSKEEYGILAKAGIDTGYQSEDISSVADNLEEAHLIIRSRILESLECDVFYRGSVEILKEEVALQREYISNGCRYTCNETNYLLLTLGDSVDAKRQWNSMQKKCPVLFQWSSGWLGTEIGTKMAGDACLDQYEALILKHSDLIARMNEELFYMTQIVERGDLKTLKASAHTMTHVPSLLPMPEWYDPETAGYLSFISMGNGGVVYPESGDKLQDADYGVYIQIPDVKRADIESYVAYARRYAALTWKAENKDAWYIMMSGYKVQIEWEDNVATILFHGEDVTFVPYWYMN